MAGCDTHDVVAAVGLKPRDLFYDAPVRAPRLPRLPEAPRQPQERPSIQKVYQYPDGLQKLRRTDKSFLWRHRDQSGRWVYDRKGFTPCLYQPKPLKDVVLLVEGEKDVDTLCELGFPATCAPDGAGPGKWRKQYSQALGGKTVVILWDNDQVGREFAMECAYSLLAYAASIRLVELKDLWPELPEHGDITDFLVEKGAKPGMIQLTEHIQTLPAWEPDLDTATEEQMALILGVTVEEYREAAAQEEAWKADHGADYLDSLLSQEPPPEQETTQEVLEEVNNLPAEAVEKQRITRKSCFRPLQEFEEQEAKWLIPGYLPQGQITLLASDGGIGKTTLWCDLVAALSSGKRTILDKEDIQREKMRVCFLTTEDSVRKKLKKKLRLSGADMEQVMTVDFAQDKSGALQSLKLGSADLIQALRECRPALCVIDPIQGFLPRDVNMASRNAMRDCLAPLISLGEEVGTSFLIVCHTNKRKQASGRDRIADSADLWDIARSVLMAGYTQDQDVRYLSNEKNNYTALQETVLFTIDENGLPELQGTTFQRDRDFVQQCATASAPSSREDCKAWVLGLLDEVGGTIASKELEERAKEAGYSYATLRRVKKELKEEKVVRFVQDGSSKDGSKVWYIQRFDVLTDLPESAYTVFD
jgi:RecA-family ATPase